MKYLSVCSGIEAASVAWHRLGWTPIAFSEVEPFPSAVLQYHFPSVPNYGDMTQYEQWPIEPGSVDLLVGGTPCQSFSVAGLRQGLRDPRGGLMLTYLEIARRFRPRWVVWENVPGVLSSDGGRDFGSFLGALGDLGYGWAYRILDAQWCRVDGWDRAVPQRRRRVFVIGCLGDGAAAATVLFESESLRGNSQACRTPREKTPADAGVDTDACRRSVKSVSTLNHSFSAVLHSAWPAEVAATLAAGSSGLPGLSNQEIFSQRAANLVPVRNSKHAPFKTNDETLIKAGESTVSATVQYTAVRRLTPREYERLQGFPDDWTKIPWNEKSEEECPDGPRYKALGNSMACNCMAWIGSRIHEYERKIDAG